MKVFLILFLLFAASCAKEKTSFAEESSLPTEKIDTTAVDSFAPGATLNNIKPKTQAVDSLLLDTKKDKDSL